MSADQIGVIVSHKKSQHHLQSVLSILMMVVVLGNCQAANRGNSQAASTPRVVAPSQSFITEQDAAKRAVRIAMQSQPEIDASSTIPRVREIKLTSFDMALREMRSEAGTADTLSQSVWFVRLSGEWNVGIPGPDITPTAYRTLFVVLDARTGAQLRVALQ